MKVLTAIKINPMGDAHPTYGQAYWGGVEDNLMPVKFNLKTPVDILPGMKIQAEEYTIKTSGKGTEYMQLKDVKVQGGRPISKSSSGSLEQKVDEILLIVKKLAGEPESEPDEDTTDEPETFDGDQMPSDFLEQ